MVKRERENTQRESSEQKRNTARKESGFKEDQGKWTRSERKQIMAIKSQMKGEARSNKIAYFVVLLDVKLTFPAAAEETIYKHRQKKENLQAKCFFLSPSLSILLTAWLSK